MKKLAFIILSIFVLQIAKAQNVVSSMAFVQTCVDKTNCFSVNHASYIFYDEPKNELILKIDFNEFKTGKDTLDSWMNDLSGSLFYFIGRLNKLEFSNLNANETKTVKIDGSIFFNDIWEDVSIEVILFQSADNSFLSQNTNVNAYDTYKITFGVSFLPKDFNIHKGPHQLKKTITVSIAAGDINQLKPGMEGLIKEIEKRN